MALLPQTFIVERQPSLFANFIPENPIIAASTTPLERRYLRHFFTYPPSLLAILIKVTSVVCQQQLTMNPMDFAIPSFPCLQPLPPFSTPSSLFSLLLSLSHHRSRHPIWEHGKIHPIPKPNHFFPSHSQICRRTSPTPPQQLTKPPSRPSSSYPCTRYLSAAPIKYGIPI